MLPGYLAAAALLVSLVALVVAIVTARRAPRSPAGPGPRPVVSSPAATPDPLPALATALRHVSVVRYDAFDDVSGRQSFTAAVLDDNGDGLVITSLHARGESRTYLKGVEAGRATGDGPDAFSPEEEQAVSFAHGGQK